MKGSTGTRAKVLAAAVFVAAALAAGIGAGPAAASETVGVDDWIKIMEIKQKAVEIQSKAAVLLDEATTEEGRQRIRACIDDARTIFNLGEDRLRGD